MCIFLRIFDYFTFVANAFLDFQHLSAAHGPSLVFSFFVSNTVCVTRVWKARNFNTPRKYRRIVTEARAIIYVAGVVSSKAWTLYVKRYCCTKTIKIVRADGRRVALCYRRRHSDYVNDKRSIFVGRSCSNTVRSAETTTFTVNESRNPIDKTVWKTRRTNEYVV